ncbi:pyridoxal phosphate-dependent aminotransferase [Idiomarina xiamenensis]|uniref:Aminotransferase n=1 Tax=Idiomarina xiamenensis 10-D-4 TaxID=740709 RepID=K2KAD8_9GAMM|nr:pyridoxal phosphate-dependent aminotransferase [Idiomarina xiamenensis]EKE79899.1 aspartate aminotransferase [Idiomarina xiamenensis 10-D-4]
MDYQLSQRVNAIQPSPTLAVTQKAAELRAAGHDIIGLGVGEPDFDTPEFIKTAAKQAIDAGKTKYTAVDGINELKQAVINKFQRDNGLTFDAKQIIISAGGKHSIFNLLTAWLDAGDEVVIPAPYWVSYPDMVKLVGAKPVIVSAGIEQRFKISAEQLEQAITPRTKLLFLNSPSNPSGTAYTADELKALAEVLRRHPQVLVASDDMYEHILWQPNSFANLAMVAPDLLERIVILSGVSKAYAMTGWRIGYAAGPTALIKAMVKVQSQSTSNPCSISQYAAAAALEGDQSCIDEMLQAFKQRHDYLVEALNAIDGVACIAGDGTFYTFADIRSLIKKADASDDIALCERLLTDAKVALVPGSAFGAPGYCRLSFATDLETLKQAVARIKAFSESL